jgi:hypothetical protein
LERLRIDASVNHAFHDHQRLHQRVHESEAELVFDACLSQDGAAIEVAHESAYRATVEAAGCQDRLVQVYEKGIGHRNVTSAQLLATLEAMEPWLNTGVRPDASFFPEDKGFDPKFVPPSWPY